MGVDVFSQFEVPEHGGGVGVSGDGGGVFGRWGGAELEDAVGLAEGVWGVAGFEADAAGDVAFGFGEGAVEDFASLAEEEEAVTEPLGVLHDMGGEEDRAAAMGEVADDFFHDLLVDGVESGEGFVEDDEFGVVGDGGEDLDFLAHAFGKGFGAGFGEVFEAVAFEQLEGAPFGCAGAESFQRGEVGDDGPGLHFLVEAFLLGEVAEALADEEGRGLAENADGAAGGADDLEDHPDGGGFAGAVRAEETVDGAGGDREADVVDGGEFAEALGDVGEFESGFAHGCGSVA